MVNYFSWFLRLGESFKRIKEYIYEKSKSNLREYFKNSTINCYRYIVDEKLESWERIIWWGFHVSTMVLAIWLVAYMGSGSLLTSINLSRAATGSPLKDVPHPRIAVCSLNRISKNKTTAFINSLQSNKSLKYTENELLNIITHLGLVYELEYSMSIDFKTIEAIINPYNLDALLKFLTPSCEKLLTRCIFRNKIINCMDFFSFRKTMDGYCCVSNYNIEKHVLRNKSAEMLITKPGIDNGLSLLLNPELDDYMFSKLPHAGIKIFISKPEDYPDIPSGGCTQIYAAPQTESFVTLDAVHITGTAEVERLPPLIRGCLFSSDKLYFKDSYSDCIIRCRKRSLRTMCHCVPFFLPLDKSDNVCQLPDMVCLKQWKDSWNKAWAVEKYLFETDDVAENLQPPPCQYCIPPCEEDTYSAKQHVVPLDPNVINSASNSEKPYIIKDIHLKDHLIVNIYFEKETVTHLIYGVLSTWYNLLSSLGGVCGLVLGGSIISLFELLYFLLGGPPKNKPRKLKLIQQSLYWNELPYYDMK